MIRLLTQTGRIAKIRFRAMMRELAALQIQPWRRLCEPLAEFSRAGVSPRLA
jgi:hypothetical protein